MIEILYFFFTLIIGLGLSSLAVIYIVYLPLKSDIIENLDPNLLYLTEYMDKFENMDDCNNIENSKKNILFENTPIGNVIMYYDDNEFKYYCDRTPSFGFLETVARKYVIVFHCKSIYKVYNEEKEKYEVKENEEKKEEVKSKKKSIYANFKTYNNNKKPKIDDNEPTLQNKYKYIGKIHEFNFSAPKEKKKEKIMTIQDFLKQIKSKSQ
tara:strand:+ start:691 stop:1320 length:630 start_codon:yes stop_codon:yes gene_type:complete